MSDTASKRPGLGIGFVVVGLVSACFAAIALFSAPPASPPQAPEPTSLSAQLTSPETATYLRTLSRHSPDIAASLEADLSAALTNGTELDQRRLALQASLAAYKAEAGWLRHATNKDYDRMVAHFADGLAELKRAAPGWCSGASLEPLLRLETDQVMPEVIEQLAAHEAAYGWALDWSGIYLETVSAAKANPIARRPRTAYDKAVLQETGLNLGPAQWALALQIGAFSQAEGSDYDTMREVIEGVNLCDMGAALAEVSSRLPKEPKGRIWADLMPEIFAGNTAYALYRVNDYFFLDPA